MKFVKLVKAEDYLIDSKTDKENKAKLIDELNDQLRSISKEVNEYFDSLPSLIEKSGLSYNQTKQLSEIVDTFDFETIVEFKNKIKNILGNGEYKQL